MPTAHPLLPTAHRPHSDPDGHLWTTPEEERPEGLTPLMAIYGEMTIYGQRSANLTVTDIRFPVSASPLSTSPC
jgi:hypothetical protein